MSGGEPKRALVTGGAGFVGSHLVERLLARGDAVTVVDDLSTGSRANLAEADPAGRVRFIESDLRQSLPALSEDEPFDEIYHLAAAVGVGLVMSRPAEAIETNVEVTSMLLRFAAGLPLAGGTPIEPAGKRPPPRVLIVSSSEVYGKTGASVFSEDDDVLYGPTSVIRWSYAYAKALDEHLALAFARQTGLRVLCVRLFNTVGPRQVGSHGMVLPRFVESARRGTPLRVFGDGSQSRCFCDVRDVSEALAALMRCGLMETADDAPRVVNLGRDEPVTIKALAELVIDEVGSGSPIEYVPYSEAYPRGFEDLSRRRPDLSRVREAIGFSPRFSLRETVRDVARRAGAAAGG